MYEGASPVLSFFGSPEGRIVKNGSTFEYQYAIADHQGNTRVVFSSVTPTPEAKTANMEAATNTDFFNYTNRVAFNLFDHTDAGTTFTYAQKLTGGSNAQVGVAKSYKVYAGDKVKIEAWAKYQNRTSTSSNLSGFATALLAAFGVPAPGGGETGTASAALNNWGGLVVGGNGGSSSGPKAFVNIIVFDKNYKLLDASWEAVDPAANQVGASPVVAHDYLMKEYTVREEGYVFMYVSNENATLVDVYFDDVVMTLTKGNVIQYNEYYPYGLQTANSWTRENTTGNNFLGNGGTELNQTSQLYDLDYRNYDPILGRMNGVDPMATKYASVSPYNFAFNDPVTLNDPSGADPYTINYSATNSHYYTAYTYDDRVDYTGLGDFNCSQCWRMEAPGAMGFYGASNGYGSAGLMSNYVRNAGSGWTASIGNLTINYNLLPNGAHAFGFNNGQATSYSTPETPNEFYGALGISVSDFGKRNLAVGNLTGNFVQLDGTGEAYVPYSSISYSDYLAGKQTSDDFSIDRWMKDHYYGEFNSELSIGAQATFVLGPGFKPILSPYIRGFGGFSVNVASLVLAGTKVTSDKSGVETVKLAQTVTQGFGVSIGPWSFDYDRRLNPFMKSENQITSTILGFGFKYNFANGDLIIGVMPKGAFALGLGGNAELISGFKL